MKTLTHNYVWVTALLAGFATNILFWFVPQGGDSMFSYALISCYAEGFWQGDLHPSWCMSANDGLGSPVFSFYFPFAYFISSLFYPLAIAWLDISQYYNIMVALAGCVTVLTVYWWLKEYVAPRIALSCALLALVLPYRSQIMYVHAFAELWCFAIMPLVWLCASRLASKRYRVWPTLTLTITLCMLCHVPATVMMMFAVGVYLLIATRLNLKCIMIFTGSALLAVGICSSYLFPGKYLMQFLNQEALLAMRNVWVNSYASIDDLKVNTNKLIVYSTGGISILLTLLLGIHLWIKHAATLNFTYSYHLYGWLAVSWFCFAFMFKWSAPLWEMMDFLRPVFAPWRMQATIGLALIFLIALKIDFFTATRQQKSMSGDMLALACMFIFMALLPNGTVDPSNRQRFNDAIKVRLVSFPEYQTLWSKKGYELMDEIVSRSEDKMQREWAVETQGSGQIINETMRHGQFTFNALLKTPGNIVIRHFYFPTWRASVNGLDHELKPTPNNGHISLTLPAGNHEIVMYQNKWHALPKPYHFLSILSLFCLAMTLFFLVRYSRRPV